MARVQIRIADGVAQLTGAATEPAHRRRGVRSALLSARLADAAAAGCDVAVIATQRASKPPERAASRLRPPYDERIALASAADAAPSPARR
jgi:GNAT superfamily N-acetyltransferase